MSDGRWLTADGRRPSCIGHRGASGIAYENSPSAFRLAKQLGADGVELDVHATGDGVLVVHHDYAIAGAGLISGLSSATSLTTGFRTERRFLTSPRLSTCSTGSTSGLR
jgi:glycerophosphoryl diester phosphodiesterase